MTSSTETPATWRSIGPQRRREVLSLARRGPRHEDAEVARAAYAWSDRPSLDRPWNRAPGWVLPLVGAVLVVLGVVVADWVLVVGGVVVALLGLLGWSARSVSLLLRGVYGSPEPRRAIS